MELVYLVLTLTPGWEYKIMSDGIYFSFPLMLLHNFHLKNFFQPQVKKELCRALDDVDVDLIREG